MEQVHQIFEKAGGVFLSSPAHIRERLKNIRAFIFDWDGVFNSGEKGESGSSLFNEVDSMGINLLRFSHFLLRNEMAATAIISGEHNLVSFKLAAREHYNGCYYKFADKHTAFDHFRKTHSLDPEEIAFFFDDVLDLSLAKQCGLRFLISRSSPSLFGEFVRQNNLADYVSAKHSGDNALRECCELIMGLNGNHDEVILERIAFSTKYSNYLEQRNRQTTGYFTLKDKQVLGQNPLSNS